MFGEHVDEFHFVDITYKLDQKMSFPFTRPSEYQQRGWFREGDRIARINWREAEAGRLDPLVEPGHVREVFARTRDGRRITVIRKRGLGQDALAEFSSRSIGVFVHRGDSPGEGGSDVYFLDRNNLFEQLTDRLGDRSLIVSDGSNAHVPHVRKFHNTEVTGAVAFEELRQRSFTFGKLDWRCVGYLGRKNGPTLVWDVTRRYGRRRGA